MQYLNNIVEQDHRSVKKRTWLAKGYGSFQSARRPFVGLETVNMIRKGRVRWVAKDDVSAQARFVSEAVRHSLLKTFLPFASNSIPL
jgi:transposase, IS6 family